MSASRRRRALVFFVILLGVILAAALVSSMPYLKYTRGIYIFLAFILIADVASLLPGKWRDIAVIIATLVFGISAIELFTASQQSGSEINAPGFSRSMPVLGWGPTAPGVYHSEKTGQDGAFVYAADYTIDDHLLRRTVSTSEGPAVAFIGDSMTFGQGLADADTLPQAFADQMGRMTPVLNFGFPGYGPQQFLHAMETGHFDSLLANTKTFVFLTAAWHAERAACRAGFMARAPRYELRDGKPVFVGACAEGAKRIFQDVIGGSASFRRFFEPLVNATQSNDVEIYLAELRRIAELVQEKYGARLIIYYMSEGNAYLANSGFTDAIIKETLQNWGIDLFDATLSPQDFPPGTLLTIPGDGHPTAIANRARAERLKNFMARLTPTAVASPSAQ